MRVLASINHHRLQLRGSFGQKSQYVTKHGALSLSGNERVSSREQVAQAVKSIEFRARAFARLAC